MYKLGLYLTVLVHHLAVLMLLYCAISCWYLLPIQFSVLVCVGVGRIAVSREPCPLTLIENLFRRKLNMKEIKGFIRHYYLSPLRRKSDVL